MRAVLLAAVLGVSFVACPSARLAAAERAAPATILVRLPADAQLTLDDQATRSQTALRRFITPPLERGKTFHYTLKARVRRGSEVVTTAREIAVRAGETTAVNLEFPGLAAEVYGSYPAATGWAGPVYYRPFSPTYVSGGYSAAYPAGVPYFQSVTPMRQQDPLWRVGPPGTGAPLFAESGIFQP